MKSHDGSLSRYAHAKLDGHMLRVVRLDNGQVECWTRRPTLLDLKWVPTLHNFWRRVPWGEVVLGELWYPGRPASHVKTAIKDRDERLQFTAWAIETHDATMTLEEVEMLCVCWGLQFAPYLCRVDTMTAASWSRSNDFEGVVFKDGNMLNHRKWKPTRTIDLVVVDWKEGNGKHLGMIGSLVCALADGTRVADVGGMTDEERAEFTLDPPIGQVVEVAYQYVGSGGRLRHPRFIRVREDKQPDECTADQDEDLCRG